MPRLVNVVPKYRKHRQSGQAIVTLSGRDYLLGPHGTRTSRIQYDRLIAEWLEGGRHSLAPAHSDFTLTELASRYWAFAKIKYVRRGAPTAELFKIKTAIQQLLKFYEDFPAREFGPRQLKVVRQGMITSGWSRNYVNQQIFLLVRMFKWGVTEGLVPSDVHSVLDLVDGLRRGESAARETEKIRCIDDAIVDATLPFLSPQVRALIELQRATGMRPGEACNLRPGDVDRTEDVWEYRPGEHKTAHHDIDRVICLGPRAQAILSPFFLRAADAYCFLPKDSAEWHLTQRHEARNTPLSCGNVPGSNRVRRRKRPFRDRFDVASYRRAIHRACDQAFPAASEIAEDPVAVKKWKSDHRWSPHRLRHNAATKARKEFGIEAAKAMLGHSSSNVTGVYAELDRQRAVEVARKLG